MRCSIAYRWFYRVTALCLVSLPVSAQIKVGDSREKVIAELGQPLGVMHVGGKEMLTYDGGVIEMVSGKVRYIDKGFAKRADKRKVQRTFEQQQRARGLVEFEGQWMSPQQKDKIQIERKAREAYLRSRFAPPPAASHPRPRPSISAPTVSGSRTHHSKLKGDYSRYVSSVSPTVLVFHADWCGICRTEIPQLDALMQNHRAVQYRKIEIKDWKDQVAKQFDIHSVPYIQVFNEDGERVGNGFRNVSALPAYLQAVSH